MTATAETQQLPGRRHDPTPPASKPATIPALVWLATACLVLVMLVASALFPVYSVPDEPFHVDMVLAVGDGGGYPQIGERVLSTNVELSTRLSRRPGGPPALPFGQRPGFEELLEPFVPGRVNRMTSHPPLYYAAAVAAGNSAIALFPPAANLAYDQQVWVYRLVSLLLVMPLPLLAFLIARRVSEDRSVALTAALFPLAVPGLTWRNGPMVNNDNLLVLLFSVVTLQLVAVAQGAGTRRGAARIGLVTGLALLTKGFALVLPAVIAAAYLAAALRPDGRRRRPQLAQEAALALGIAALVGGWWWIRNLTVYGQIQPAGAEFELPVAGFVAAPLEWLGLAAGNFVETFWWVSVGPQPWAFWLLLAAPIGLLAVGLLASPRRTDRWLLALPAAGIVAIMTYGSYLHFASTGVVRGTNGRYVYAALAALAVLMAIGLSRLLGKRRRWAPAAILALACAVQWAALEMTSPHPRGIPREDGILDDWASLMAWSPIGEPALQLAMLAAALALVALAAGVVAHGLRSGRSGGHTGPGAHRLSS